MSMRASRTVEILVEAQHDIMIATDRAIPLALMVNEFITNAAKHAYAGQSGCKIWVGMAREAGTISLGTRRGYRVTSRV